MRYFVVLLFLANSLPAFASVSVGDLNKSCSEKMLVYSRAGGIVGEKVDSYCAGYLQATAEALQRRTTCANEIDNDPNFLRSVFQKYMTEKKVKSTDNAAATLATAFQRAFDCK